MKIHSLSISPEHLKNISEIDAFSASWDLRHSLTPERLSALRHVATIESIGSSTRIEGARLSDAEVEQLLGRLEQQSLDTRDEQEVAGYADAMETIFSNYLEIPLTENYLKQLHSILLSYSEKDNRHRGQYKTLNNHVEAFDSDGNSLGIVIKTATPFDTPREMEALVRWTRESLEDKSIHPLLVIGVFNVVFLAIHPFQDGNGRVSRVIATLLLLRAGYHYVPYSSLESVIERSKDSYYLALRRTQSTLDQSDPDWQPWLTFFLRSLVSQKTHLETKLTASQGWDALPKDSVAILNYLSDNERITASEAENLTQTPRSTLKLRLKELQDKGLIQRHGKARGTWYVLAEPLK
ncbi:Fic family protein [Leucothrix arctica]|uniref:Fic family protein n=1 Tax=Leucothrix arctica TaxID=1481894 RepID=A0A317C4D6_9GAMM|nr:Fic family protein [Leucothrix arctica]PWQ93167.1 Fic family protein [Leucothrix arctica]